MSSKRSMIASALLAGGLLIVAPSSPQAAETEHPAPASALVEHARLLERLEALAQRPNAVGAEGKHLLDAIRAHLSYREEVVLPAFALLPRLADGVVTQDMAWAMALGDRVRRDRDQHLHAHLDITERLLAVLMAAQTAGDAAAVQEAQDVAAFMLGDAEVDENVTALIGNCLRQRLSAGG
jgi:hypothetical protein